MPEQAEARGDQDLPELLFRGSPRRLVVGSDHRARRIVDRTARGAEVVREQFDELPASILIETEIGFAEVGGAG